MIELTIDNYNQQFVLEIKDLDFKEYSDFYYFVWDNGLVEKENILLENQIENLISWHGSILGISSGEIYLPFDFFDQYLGCLRLSKNNNDYLMSYGIFDNVHAASPSYCRPLHRKKDMGNFIETLQSFKIDVKELLTDIERIVSDLFKELSV